MPILGPRFQTRYPNGLSALPRGGVADTSAGLGGFVGFYTPAIVEVDDPNGVLIAGVVVTYESGSFVVLSTGDEEEPEEKTYEVTVSRLFDVATAEAQVKLSVAELAPEGIGDKVLSKRLEQPVLLTPGIYRIDFGAALSETYEFDGGVLPVIRVELIEIRFSPHFFTDDAGTPCFGLKAYTVYDLDTGTAGSAPNYVPYEFPEDVEPPLACDVATSNIPLVEWKAILLQRAIGVGIIPDAGRRAELTDQGWIRDSWTTELAAAPSGGGAIDKQQTYTDALTRISWEIGYDFDGTAHDARLIRIPRAAEDPEVQRTITVDDIKSVAEDNSMPRLAVTWTPEVDVVNVANPRFLRDYSEPGEQAGSYDLPGTRATSSTSAADKIGEQQDEPKFLYDWLRDLAVSNEVTGAWIRHLGSSVPVVEFTGFLNQLDLERGDTLAFNLAPHEYLIDSEWIFAVESIAHNFIQGEVKVGARRIV